MKRVGIIFLAVTTFLLSSGQAFADEGVEDIQSKVVERFDTMEPEDGDSENHRWIARGSKFSSSGYPMVKNVKAWPSALFRSEPEGVDLNSLGIRGSFDRTGYNYIELIPVAQEDVDGIPVPQGIVLPGRVKKIDLWIWGSGYDYYAELEVRDYEGMTHVLNIGDISHEGWKNFIIEMPSSIKQNKKYLPRIENLQLTKITVWTKPGEKVIWSNPGISDKREKGGFYVYFDHIKVTTDLHEHPYDGEDLANPENVEELWGDSSSESEDSTSSESEDSSAPSDTETSAQTTEE